MTPSTYSDRRHVRLLLGLFLGAVVVFQVGWLIAVPPYSQMDEVAHAYRAASVAHGHLGSSSSTSPEAIGKLIRVPEAMVTAAHQACAGLAYVKRGDCTALSAPDRHGDVLIGSTAAGYDPFYYAIVGVPAVYLAPHSGMAMEVIMRALTMIWCDLLIAAALLLTVRRTRSVWPTAGVMITAMPVVLCASVAAAPNGVQMSAGLLMWAAMAALIFGETAMTRSTWPLAAWSLASCLVLLTHPTGSLWFGISFILGLALAGRRRVLALYRGRRAAVIGATLPVIAAGVFSVPWTLLARADLTTMPSTTNTSPPWIDYLQQPMLWLLQCIGVVPFRNQFGPPLAYAFALAVIVAFIVVALRQRYHAGRRALITIMVIALGISVGLDRLTYHSQGHGWQGRYTLALTYGIPVIAAWIIGTYSIGRNPRGSVDRVLTTAVGAAVGLTNAIILVNIWSRWCRPHWLHDQGAAPSTLLILALAAVGSALMIGAFVSLVGKTSPPEALV